MKIYFYDGNLEDWSDNPLEKIDAKYGPSANQNKLSDLLWNNTDEILTNSLVALSHEYGWNHQENHTDIYLWVDELHRFIRVDRLTIKYIRWAHNIEKMYLAGTLKYTGELYDEQIGEVNNE